MSQFKFSVGPWNIHEGADVFGPPVRRSFCFEEKVKRFKDIGFDAVQFHDDDAVPEIDNKSATELEKEAGEKKKILDDNGLKAEFVAPRLWGSPKGMDGSFSSNDPQERKYAIDRSKRAVDICRTLGCDLLGFWYAREGTVCAESKNPRDAIGWMIEGLNEVLEYDKGIRIFIEPKPNEPIDRSFAPTMGHAMALAASTVDPSRVGGLVESAHAILAGLDPATEMAFAMATGKLFGVHLNDQNSLRFDQDKAFAGENLRQGFNQIRVLVNGGFGKNGEYVGMDVKAMRTQPEDLSFSHLANSVRMVKLLEQKVAAFDEGKREEFIRTRDYEGLEMYTLEVLLGA